MLSLNDLCDRPPRPLAEGEVLDVGGKRVRRIATPHVPHNWEAQVLFEESTSTLFCGDVLTQIGDDSALTTGDVVEPGLAAEVAFRQSSMAPHTGDTLRRLGDPDPTTLAIMHGSSYRADGAKALYDLAAAYEEQYILR
jgi:glyoxylase-like metal-dependent hydrolase (beta-lactamase superfamily II)